jgi:TPR repeat protein
MTLKNTLLAATAVALFMSGATSAMADSYAEGLEAFKKKDYASALAIWTPLAEEGDVSAQYNIARMYDGGIGVAEDDARAAEYYALAANADFTPAMFQLGMDYIEGEGVAADAAKGMDMLEEAASLGDADANFQLGMLYREGDLVKKDYNEAMKWYLTAAAQGHAQAQYMIGFMYGSGYGVPQDFVMAYYYYSLAADDIDISVRAREHLAEYMTPDEITQAMTLVTQQRTVASSGQSLVPAASATTTTP